MIRAFILKHINKEFLYQFIGRAFVCRFLEQKHQYEYRSSNFIGQRPFMRKTHIICCPNCHICKEVEV